MVFVVLFVVVVAAAVVCNFCRTQIAVDGHRIQGGSPAPLLFPYAVGVTYILYCTTAIYHQW